MLLCALPVLVAGCGGPAASSEQAQPGALSVEAKAAAVSPRPSADAVGDSPTGTPLYARLATSSAIGDTGQALTATLAGTTYRSATGVWIGCEGTASTAVYRLGGEFAKLTGVLGLQPHTPAGLRVRISFVVDGENKLSATLTRDARPQPISIALDAARSVTVSALALDGTCAPAASPYGAIGAASLT